MPRQVDADPVARFWATTAQLKAECDLGDRLWANFANAAPRSRAQSDHDASAEANEARVSFMAMLAGNELDDVEEFLNRDDCAGDLDRAEAPGSVFTTEIPYGTRIRKVMEGRRRAASIRSAERRALSKPPARRSLCNAPLRATGRASRRATNGRTRGSRRCSNRADPDDPDGSSEPELGPIAPATRPQLRASDLWAGGWS